MFLFWDFFEEREVSSGVPTIAGCVPGFEHRATAGKHGGRNRIQDVHHVYSDYQIKLQGPKIPRAHYNRCWFLLKYTKMTNCSFKGPSFLDRTILFPFSSRDHRGKSMFNGSAGMNLSLP